MKIITPVDVEIKPSEFLKNEIGLFATRTLSRGRVIGNSKTLGKEEFHKWSEIKKSDSITQKKIFDYCLGTEKGFYMPINLNAMTLLWHMNHNCDGNVGFDKNGDFVLIKNVKRGEELCWDYGLAESNPNFKMQCKCGSKRCRGIITGNDWKEPIYNKRNKNYMLPDLRLN